MPCLRTRLWAAPRSASLPFPPCPAPLPSPCRNRRLKACSPADVLFPADSLTARPVMLSSKSRSDRSAAPGTGVLFTSRRTWAVGATLGPDTCGGMRGGQGQPQGPLPKMGLQLHSGALGQAEVCVHMHMHVHVWRGTRTCALTHTCTHMAQNIPRTEGMRVSQRFCEFPRRTSEAWESPGTAKLWPAELQ